MKISKDSHRKTAVSIKNGMIEGELYELHGMDLCEVVKRRANSTKFMYKVFGDPEEDANVSENARKITGEFNNGIHSLKAVFKKKEMIKREEITGRLDVDRIVEVLKLCRQSEGITESDIDESLNRLLKNSLRHRAKARNALKLLMCHVYLGSELTPEEKESVKKYFIERLVKEYHKNTEKNEIPKAIECQNMVIQPGEGGVLKLSGNDTKYKDKEALRDFLTAYATLNGKVRHELRIKLRRLVDLYFYDGDPAGVDDSNGSYEWDAHSARKGDDTVFADIVISQSGCRPQINSQEALLAVKEWNMDRYHASLKAVKADGKGLYFDREEMNIFWLRHISSEVERIYKKIKPRTERYKFTRGYASEKVWKGILNFLSIKYIAEGKAVYNFAMGAIDSDGTQKRYGVTDREYLGGITSY